MPFVQWIVHPKNLSKAVLHDENGAPIVCDGELEAVTNFTFCSIQRQLLSLMSNANKIFDTLNQELLQFTERSLRLKLRLKNLEETVEEFDPKSVTVPESSLTAFSERTVHYESNKEISENLFTLETRPPAVRLLYGKAKDNSVFIARQIVRNKFDQIPGYVYFSCSHLDRTAASTKLHLDIETRVPAAVSALRPWTSVEALGNVTVNPECTNRIQETLLEDGVEHRLPSPEEQVQAIALKFPSEIVSVDVTGKAFNRMSALRRSLQHVDYDTTGVVNRRVHRHKRSRSKRRNTIAGTDQKELEAVVGSSSDANFGKDSEHFNCERNPTGKKSHLNVLKEWGRSRLRLIKNIEPISGAGVKLRDRSNVGRKKCNKEDQPPYSSSGNWSASSESGHSTATSHHPRSSSSGSGHTKHSCRTTAVSTSSSVASDTTLTPDDGETCSMYSCDTEGYYTSFHLDSGLKTLKEEECSSRMNSNTALNNSNSQNNSTSSTLNGDSEYELFGKGSTSTTASSAGTVCTSLRLASAPPFIPKRVNSKLSLSQNTSSSTPSTNNSLSKMDTNQDSSKLDVHCSTDANNKCELTESNIAKLGTEYSDYKVHQNNFVITVQVHDNDFSLTETMGVSKCGDSPDSGHNTCSSPVDSVASPSVDLEMSECSDLEGVDRVERIRSKTAIDSSRIPSMCVITPPQSDDEACFQQYVNVDLGEYVTIRNIQMGNPLAMDSTNSEILSDEYVSLNELDVKQAACQKRIGARVTLNSEGKVVYSSDSLRRRKAIHTTKTFEPGPNVVHNKDSIPMNSHRMAPTLVKPVISRNKYKTEIENSKLMNDRNITQNQRPANLSYLADNKKISFESMYKNNVLASSSNKVIPSTDSVKLQHSTSYRANQGNIVNDVYDSRLKKNENTRESTCHLVKAATCKDAVYNAINSKGAYVRMQDPTDFLDQQQKVVINRTDSYRLANNESLVKRSDSYRIANNNEASLLKYNLSDKNQMRTKQNLLLTAVQSCHQIKQEENGQQIVKSSTPVKGSPYNRSLMADNISPISSPSSVVEGNGTGNNEQKRQTYKAKSTLFPLKSKVHDNLCDKKPPNSRSAMELFAIIHDSRKRIFGKVAPSTASELSPTIIGNNNIKSLQTTQNSNSGRRDITNPITSEILRKNNENNNNDKQSSGYDAKSSLFRRSMGGKCDVNAIVSNDATDHLIKIMSTTDRINSTRAPEANKLAQKNFMHGNNYDQVHRYTTIPKLTRNLSSRQESLSKYKPTLETAL